MEEYLKFAGIEISGSVESMKDKLVQAGMVYYQCLRMVILYYLDCLRMNRTVKSCYFFHISLKGMEGRH